MSFEPFPSIDPDIPRLLKQLLEQTGDKAAQQATLTRVGAERLAAASTLMGALCLGGATFAAGLVVPEQEAVSANDRYAVVLDAFNAVVNALPDPPPDHEAQVAAWLIQTFGLPNTTPATLLDGVRAEFLITVGPADELPAVAETVIGRGQWALALRGLLRCHETLQKKTPHRVYGMAAMCLHKLGRYEEAERWVARGLGDRAGLLSIAPVRTEAELVRQWSGRRAPVISILCTTYNHERYIEQTIRGFLSQDCSYCFEILIHDDASTDGTQQIIRRWQAQYPAVIKPVLQTENQFSKGVRPFELLLAKARGDFVATCEGDDFWIDPSKLKVQVGFLKGHPEFSCTAHNYYHFVERDAMVTRWTQRTVDYVLSERQLMGLHRLLWWPTLVFRKTFSTLPAERALSPIGDQFMTSYLGTQGRAMYFVNLMGAVRRENEFSTWSPLSDEAKERIRVKVWVSLVRLHARLGNGDAVTDLMAKIAASSLHHEGEAALADLSLPVSLTAP